MKTLILNSSNVVPSSNNSKYKLNLSNANFVAGDKIAIHSIQIPYSWFNISDYYSNNKFQYKFNGVVYDILLYNQFLTIDDINLILKENLIMNGHYLVDSNGENWYPMNLSYNTARYCVQFDSFLIPPTLPTNYTNPGNVFYNTAITPFNIFQLIIPSTNITKIFGFNAGIYPPSNQTSRYAKLSDFIPNGSEVNSILVKCNLCSNDYSGTSDMIYSFPIGNTSFGTNIEKTSYEFAWIDIKTGSKNDITIEFCDQNYKPIFINDPNVCIQLLIKNKDE